jgi:hypothetical protein
MRQTFCRLRSPQSIRMPVVILEPVTLRAPPALVVDVAASPSVTRVNRPPDRGGYVPRTSRNVRARDLLPGSLRRAKAPGFEPFQLLGHGLLDDLGEIAIGDLGPHERLEPLQLPTELRARRELDPAAGRGQRLDHRSRS